LLSNIEAIAEVARQLGPICERVVFLGGAVTGLLITDTAAPEIRNTDDVDVIINVASRSSYYNLEDELRALGFTQRHAQGDPICRWGIDGIVVDIMPTDESILGFSNRWYVPAIERAMEMSLPNGLGIRVITPPDFLATKLEAFLGRGQGDFLLSQDIADIVSLIDGRVELVAEVSAADLSVRQFIAISLSDFQKSQIFAEALAGHMLPDAISQQRISLVLERIDQLIRVAT